jgi:hypothetical protein
VNNNINSDPTLSIRSTGAWPVGPLLSTICARMRPADCDMGLAA